MPKSHVSRFEPFKFQENILGWYHQNQRVLPWRMVGRQKTDPYKVWMSEIMLQQTTVPAVIPYFHTFTENWPTVVDLANAQDADVMAAWAGLGYYARARNLLKCARVVANELGGKFPKDLDELLALPGIGPYTAAAITAIAYGKPATVVDGNIERITSRIFAIADPYPEGKKFVHQNAHRLFDNIDVWEPQNIKAYPQALMDIGAGICTPKNPSCGLCPVQEFCKAYAEGTSDKYPVKAAKKAVPIRHGDVYWIQDKAGNVVFQKRSDKRMLGGMMGLPTTDWDLNMSKVVAESPNIPKILPEMMRIGNVYHVFTHFRLELTVWAATVPDLKNMIKLSPDFLIINPQVVELDKIGLPTLFLKAARLAHKSF
jgi:A/G-specific adenine glycosylase